MGQDFASSCLTCNTQNLNVLKHCTFCYVLCLLLLTIKHCIYQSTGKKKKTMYLFYHQIGSLILVVPLLKQHGLEPFN